MKIITFLILLIGCAFTQMVKAQSIVYNKMYDDFNGWEIANSVYELNDSSVLASFQTIDFFATDSTQYRRLYFSMLSKQGDVLKKEIGKEPNAEFSGNDNIRMVNGELFTIAVYSYTDTAVKQNAYAKGIYLDSEASVLRTIPIKLHYIPGSNPNFRIPYLTSSGNFLGWASYRPYVGDSIYLFSSDSNGNVLWVKEYPNLHMAIPKIIETPDKGFLLVGYEYEYEKYVWIDNRDYFRGHPERLWYAKIDSMGNLQWQHLFTGAGYELYDTVYNRYKISNQTRFRDAIPTADGNYVLVGCVENNPYMTKITADGTQLWERKYYKQLHYMDTLRRRALFVDIKEKDGYLYALGYMDSLEANAQSTVSYTFLMKLTGTGKTIWIRYFNTGEGGDLYSVIPSKSGFYLTGSIQDTIPKHGSQDAWILKLDTNGCLQLGCELNDVFDTITSVRNISKDSKPLISIYPNPSATGIYTLKGYEGKDATLFIFNQQGQQMLKQSFSNASFDLQNQPEGMYYMRLMDTNGRLIHQQAVLKTK